MKHIIWVILLLVFLPGYSQVRIFSGFIGKAPVQMVTFSYSDGDTRAIYAYDKFDTPIVINGRQRNDSLELLERDERGEVTSVLRFPDFGAGDTELRGSWISQERQTQYEIRLTRMYEFSYYDSTDFERMELLQPASTKDHYFRLLITKSAGEAMQVVGVRVYAKGSDRLIQELDLDCEFWGLDNVSVADYNFDGLEDFSVFEASYAGPNTSSIYILRDPLTEKYFISEISGTSLEFDPGSRLIYEHNQCCAGSRHMNATYRLVDNKMELIQQTCLVYDEETEEFVEADCD